MSSKSDTVISNTTQDINSQEKTERRTKAKRYFFYPILIGLSIFFVFGVFVSPFISSYFGIVLIGILIMVIIFYIFFSWIYIVFIICNKDTRGVRITLFSLFSIISIITSIYGIIDSNMTNQGNGLDAVTEMRHSNTIQYPEKVGKLVLSSVREKNVKTGTKRGLPNGKFVSMEEGVNIYYSPENNLEYPFANIHIEKSSSGLFEQDKSSLIDLIKWEKEESNKEGKSNMIEYFTGMILSQYPYQEITMKESNSGVKSHIVIFDKNRDTSITIYFLNQGNTNNIYKNNTEFLEKKKQFLEEFLSFYK